MQTVEEVAMSFTEEELSSERIRMNHNKTKIQMILMRKEEALTDFWIDHQVIEM